MEREGMANAMVPNIRALIPALLIAGVLPIVAYAILRPHVSSDAVALAAVLVFPIAEIVYERLHTGRFEPIGIISLIGITAGLIGAVALSGDALLLKIRHSAVTGLFGVVCLLSLAARRPAMFSLGRAFATGGDAEKAAEFDTIWDLPSVPRRFRLITLIWGVVLVAEAALSTALALAVPTQLFLILGTVINWTVLGCLLAYTVRFSRAGEAVVLATAAQAEPEPDPHATPAWPS